MPENALYTVEKIDGDYALLRRLDKEMDDLKPVAMALLPPETDEGVQLEYINFEYSVCR